MKRLTVKLLQEEDASMKMQQILSPIKVGMFILISLVQPLYGKEQASQVKVSLEEYLRMARSGQVAMQTSEGSLYAEASPNWNLFSDSKARRENDILTIQVTENTSATSTADAQTGRKGSMAASTPNLFGLENHVSSLPLNNLLAINSDAQFKGSGSTTRAGVLTAYLSARVVEVLPNGNMVVQGIKELKVNNERQVLSLYGVVRPRDIGPNNVVSSSNIANMQVHLDGKGAVSENIKPGYLFRILSKFWPF
jgi:flagellar L-ring protein precursor FlgH